MSFFDTRINRYRYAGTSSAGTPADEGPKNTYDSTGLWNPTKTSGDRTFGIMPELKNATPEGFTTSLRYNVLNLFPGYRNDPAAKGTGMELELGFENRSAYVGGTEDPFRKFYFFRDYGFTGKFDTGKLAFFDVDSRRIANRLDLRGVFDARIRHNGTQNDWRGDYGASIGADIYNPITIGIFGMIKRWSHVLSYSDKFKFKDENADYVNYYIYGATARDNFWYKMEIALWESANPDSENYVAYWKHRFTGSNKAFQVKEETERYGFSVFSSKGWYATLEAFKSPDYSSGEYIDKYGNRLDLDVYAGYKIDLIPKNTDPAKSLFLNIGMGSTEIISSGEKGYRIPVYMPQWLGGTWKLPLGVLNINVGVTGRFKGFTVDGNFNAIIRGEKMKPGIFDEVKVFARPATDVWEGISVTEGSGATQVAHKTPVIETKEIRGYSGAPKITIRGDSVKYMTRTITGGVGNNAVSGWTPGSSVANALFIKSVKIVDKAHGKVYGLTSSGSFSELTGTQPATPPDLSSAGMFLNDSSMTFDLPQEMYVRDGVLKYSIEVEYGCETSILETAALINYYADGALKFDPSEDVETVYQNRVKWVGHPNDPTASDPHRISVMSYNITQPYDEDTNAYYVGTKKLAPINLNVTAVY